MRMFWCMLLLFVACTLLSPLCHAFVTPPVVSFKQVSVFSPSRHFALIYMPDGEVVHDDEGDQRVVHEGSTAILGYLNAPDFRAPLAVLTAAHSDVDIRSIQQISATHVTPKTLQIEAICAVDETNCANVQVTLDFPVVCQDESEIIQTLNQMHQDASAKLEQKRVEQEEREEMNVRPVPSTGVVEKKQADIPIQQVKRTSHKKQQALLAARLERQVKARAETTRRDAEARETAAAKFKEEMRLESQTRRMKQIQAQEEQRRIDETKREAHAKQRALLSARLQREEAIRATIRQRQEEMVAAQQAIEEARSQPKPKQEGEALATRYGAMDDTGERAFAILVDLGMVTVSPDPNSADYDDSQDNEFVE